MAYTVNRQSSFKYHIRSNYSVACHKETFIKLLWRTRFRQVLGPLFIFSGELLSFSFYCKRVWGQCLMPLGKPGPVTRLFVVPVFFFFFFFSSICGLVWVGATPRIVMNTYLQGSLMATFHFTMRPPHTHPFFKDKREYGTHGLCISMTKKL